MKYLIAYAVLVFSVALWSANVIVSQSPQLLPYLFAAAVAGAAVLTFVLCAGWRDLDQINRSHR